MARWRLHLTSFALFGALLALPALAGYLAGGVFFALALTLLLVGAGLTATRYAERYVLAAHDAIPLDRDDAPRLYALLEELAARAGISVPRLHLIESATPNAFTVGRPGRRASIAVTTGLLRRLDPREVAGVLAHEIAHVRHGDVVLGAVAATVTAFLFSAGRLLVPLTLLLLPLLLAFAPAFLLAVAVIFAAPFAALLLQAAHSRRRELAADAEASRLTGDPIGLAAALERLRPRRHTLFSLLFGYRPEPLDEAGDPLHSHPPTHERIDRLLAMSQR